MNIASRNAIPYIKLRRIADPPQLGAVLCADMVN